MKLRKVNIQILIEIISLLLFSIVYLYMAISGKYLIYITPRMKPYLFFLAIIMIIFAISLIRKIYTFSYKKHIAHCLIIIIPIVSLIIPHNAIGKVSDTTGVTFLKGSTSTSLSTDTDNIDYKSKNSDNSSLDQNNSSENSSVQSKTNNDVEKQTFDDGYGNKLSLHGCDQNSKTITISNNEFIQWVNVLFANIDIFTNYEVTMTGSIYKDDSLEKDEFIPARLVMTCCIADLVPCGLICHYSNVINLEENSWVTVTGKLINGKYNGNNEPQLVITNIEKAQPIEGYLYPY